MLFLVAMTEPTPTKYNTVIKVILWTNLNYHEENKCAKQQQQQQQQKQQQKCHTRRKKNQQKANIFDDVTKRSHKIPSGVFNENCHYSVIMKA